MSDSLGHQPISIYYNRSSQLMSFLYLDLVVPIFDARKKLCRCKGITTRTWRLKLARDNVSAEALMDLCVAKAALLVSR